MASIASRNGTVAKCAIDNDQLNRVRRLYGRLQWRRRSDDLSLRPKPCRRWCVAGPGAVSSGQQLSVIEKRGQPHELAIGTAFRSMPAHAVMFAGNTSQRINGHDGKPDPRHGHRKLVVSGLV